MKFKCCRRVLNCLSIGYDYLAFCLSNNSKHYFVEKFFYFERNNTADLYLQKRSQIIEKFKNGIVPDNCKNCPEYKEIDDNAEVNIKYVYIANRTACSCNCIYCYRSGKGNLKKKRILNTQKVWDIRKFLEEFENKNLFANDCRFVISGGNPEEFPKDELQWLLNFATSKKRSAEILTAGIYFSKEIETVLKEKSNVILIVSVDSATREVYEKIKRVNFYDAVWLNIKKYIDAAKNNPNSDVCIKYILIPNVNTDLNEIKEFLNKCAVIECNNIKVDFENYWISAHGSRPLPVDIRKAAELFMKNKNVLFSKRYTYLNEITLPINIFDIKIADLLLNKTVNLKLSFTSDANDCLQEIKNEKNLENLSKYVINASKNNKSKVMLFYKVVPNINDSDLYINSLISMMRKSGCSYCELSVFSSEITEIYKERLSSIARQMKNAGIEVNIV